MEELNWEGPYRFGDWIQGIISYRPDHDKDAHWPPSRQGVYAVTASVWISQPWNLVHTDLLYVGGGRNIIDRIGSLVQDLLGFCGPSEDGGQYAGSHSGGEKLWCYCNKDDEKWKRLNVRGIQTKDLYIGWAVASKPCHTCIEAALLLHHKGVLNDRDKPTTKCCCPPV